MAQTADLRQSIWTEPWFLALNPNAKVLYLWAISTRHGNLAGLFTVARQVIQVETGLNHSALKQAFADCGGKLFYDPDTGAMWVRGRVKNIRTKSRQIAKHVAACFRACPVPEFQRMFLDKYGHEKWLADAFAGLSPGEPTVAAPVEQRGVFLDGTDEEQQLVDSLLRAFNVEANGIYRAETWGEKVVRCIRAHPELTEADHLRVVRTAFASRWWTGAATPGVIWGNLAQFEKCVAEARQPKKETYEDATEVIYG